MESRQRKGLEISGTLPITQRNGYWIVPSQSNPSQIYRVCFEPKERSCSCPDFELHEPAWCKHIYAVRYKLEELGLLPRPIPRSPQRDKYPRDWHDYKEGKLNEPAKFKSLLYDLCRGLKGHVPSKKGGRPRIPISDVVYAAVTKIYEGASVLEVWEPLEYALEAEYISQIPKPSTILNFFNAPESADILRTLIAASCNPVREIETTFPVDSTTFQLPRYKRWFDRKRQSAMERRDTVKANLICGVRTHVIAWVTVTDGDAADGPQFPHLLHHASKCFRILETSADKAYSSDDNYRAADEIGAKAYIAFKRDSTGWSGGLYGRMYRFYQLRRKEFRERYNLRSNAESTGSMLKRRFQGPLSFKNDQAIENEVLGMVLVHNICVVIKSMYELGTDTDFWEKEGVR